MARHLDSILFRNYVCVLTQLVNQQDAKLLKKKRLPAG
jgi:hypothetical protein